MIPGKYNIVCPQGSSLDLTLMYSIADSAIDLTGYDAKMQVREKHSSTNFIFDFAPNTGNIFLNEIPGSIRIFIPADMTELVIAKNYVYDLELIPPDVSLRKRILEGMFIMTPEVTRS